MQRKADILEAGPELGHELLRLGLCADLARLHGEDGVVRCEREGLGREEVEGLAEDRDVLGVVGAEDEVLDFVKKVGGRRVLCGKETPLVCVFCAPVDRRM